MKLTFICPTFDASGYAEAARSMILGFYELGVSIRILPKDWSQLDAELPVRLKQKLFGLCGSEIFPEGPIIQICEAQDFQPISGRINIGITMLECDRLPQTWVERCNQMDQVWVPSTFNHATFISSGVDPQKIKVVPIGVDVDRFHPSIPPMKIRERKGDFLFLSNFEWISRKGYDLLLRAYLEEFTASDPVTLVIKTYDGSQFDPHGAKMRREWEEMIKRYGIVHPPSLKLITDGMAYEEIPSFYTAGDCYIIPTRGEGWNLPALEAMSSGLPVITTDWSAHLDFVNEENGYLIQVDKLEPIPAYGIPNDKIYSGALWAVPSYSDLRKWMRHAFRHQEEVKRKGKLARAQVTQKWGTLNMIKRMIGLLSGLGV